MYLRDKKMRESNRKYVFPNIFKNTIKHLKTFFGTFSRTQPKT